MHAKNKRRFTLLGLYLLLIAGSAVFTLPFIWMVGTSFKLEREMSNSDLQFIPDQPLPAQTSPYYDTRHFPEPKTPAYARSKELIEARLRSDGTMDPDAIPDVLPATFARLERVVPPAAWEDDDAALARTIEKFLTTERIATVKRQVSRELQFSSVRVRSLDLQEIDLTTVTPAYELWTIEEGNASFEPTGTDRKAVLHYDVSAAEKQTIHASAMLKLPFPGERLHRIQIGLTPDDSWHRLDFFIESDGVRYEAVRPQILGDNLPTVVVLQEFGPDDSMDSSKIKLWTPYKEVARDAAYDHGPHAIKVEMVMQESSVLDAWMGKIGRNYIKTMAYIPFWRYTATSVFLVILNIAGTIFSCSLAAYAFARLNWPGRNIGFGLMLATMMIPPQVTMIPYFLIIKSLGWYNTLTPLWIMSFFGNAFNIFLLRQFMKGIPRDLEDAAKIDGCNFMHIYWNVIMPLIKPSLACISVFTFLGTWNNFMGPLIFLSDQRLFPLSLGLYAFKVQQGGDFGMMMAGSLLMTLPIIAIFFFAQRYFIQGIALTGTKG